MTTIAWIGDGELGVDRVGGKGRSLDTLHCLGLRVPEAFVVTTHAYRQAVGDKLVAEIDRRIAALGTDPDPEAVSSVSDSVRALVIAETADHSCDADIRAAYQQLASRLGQDEPAVAVRSSSAAEDSADRSFAGEHDSYLWVLGVDEVSAAVRQCWASLFTARAISYRARGGADVDDVMGVVVQRMVDADAAGVFMTLNPVNGDRSKVVVESVWGLGEPLVSATATPDRFVLDKITGEIIERNIVQKPTRATRNPVTGRGLATVPVDEADHSLPSLDDTQLRQLLDIARTVERHAGTPQDGEFAVADGEVHLVQARPETVWSSKPAPRITSATGAMGHVLSALTDRN
ncbi:PEP/pyruvate-binding domain-containing protein [Kutzneria chonburiensis]|uniref:Phosphoenolpyruvate synthase n=1 Tax=Kutzneria chonburiensis TaxID=1483604 RepID=A0ABV6MQC3_9PSEU|nr:PEP/pyruvate-binding domain-containing protein [Kutzneria chonburiensis]